MIEMGVITVNDYNQMKSWVSSIYQKTKGSTPSIPSITQDSVALASQVNTLQSLLNTAYSSYVDLNCTHNATVKTTHYTGDNSSHGNNSQTTTGNVTVKSSNYTYNSGSYGCTSYYSSDDTSDGSSNYSSHGSSGSYAKD